MSASVIVNWSMFLVIGGSFFLYYNPQTLQKIWPLDRTRYHTAKPEIPAKFPSEIQRKRKKRTSEITKTETTATESDSGSAVAELRLSERSSQSSRRPSSSRSMGSSRAVYTITESPASPHTVTDAPPVSENSITTAIPKIEQKLTKKQRQNQRKREEQKAIKAQLETARQQKLEAHLQELDSDRSRNSPRGYSNLQQTRSENPWIPHSKKEKKDAIPSFTEKQLHEGVVPVVIERNESGDEEIWEDHKAFERIQQESDNGWQIVGKPKRK